MTAGQSRLLENFYELPQSGEFFLTGGTALAEFYLGHRESHDLDFFSAQEGLIQSFAKDMQNILGQKFNTSMSRIFNNFAEMICAIDDEEVRIHLAYDSPFRLEPPIKLNKVIVNDFSDLVADKLLTFFGRGELRDAVDLFFIISRERIPFWELEKLAREKDPGFDLYWMARACAKVQTFPDDLNNWSVQMVIPAQGGEIKKFFDALALEIIQNLKRGS